MITVKNLYKSFDNRQILKDINLEFLPQKNNLIIGRSGSGKTVLMKCLVGLLEPNQGEILFDGTNFVLTDKKTIHAIRRDIGMVFQGGALFDSLNVEANVMFPLDIYTNMTLSEKRQRANFCLERVNLAGTNKLFPPELSGGMKKRAAIARAIATNPKYLFCDEPNTGLDPQTSAVIDALISEITQEFKTITIINTHDMNSVMQMGDNIAFIHEGQVWWKGDKNNICATENAELITFLESSELTKRVLLSHK
ncbi:ABC transporter ATP-binding protein [Bacteroidia bacterium]|nr:ABC transporter ATP-binding protein [Bacteroidia bacterium]